MSLAQEITQKIQTLSINQPEPPVTRPAKATTSWVTTLLWCLALFLLTLGFGLWHKRNLAQSRTDLMAAETPLVQPHVPPTQSPMVRPQPGDDSRFAQLQRQIDLLQRRQWLLGLAHNQNVTVMNQFISRYDQELAKQIVVLSKEWKLSRMPSFLEMTDEERQALLRDINNSD